MCQRSAPTGSAPTGSAPTGSAPPGSPPHRPVHTRRTFLRGAAGAVAAVPLGVLGGPGALEGRGHTLPVRGEEAPGESPIGRTPLLPLRHLPDPGGAEIWVKWEGANPTGSMKDRLALGLLEAAEREGTLRPGMRVVELTGGSTGSSLAMVCAPRGYRAHFVTSDAVSVEKRRAMAALGATLEVFPSHGEGITPELVERSMVRVRELAEEPDTYWTNQFENPANARGYLALGEELVEAGPVDAFVMGVGTGGCITGVATALSEAGVEAHVVAVEPAASRNLSGGPTGGHRIEGIGLGFVPETYEAERVHEIMAVSDEEAFEATRALAREEGLFAGPSSGANLVAARRVAARLGRGRRVVTLLCDTGLRYLADDLFDLAGAEGAPPGGQAPVGTGDPAANPRG